MTKEIKARIFSLYYDCQCFHSGIFDKVTGDTISDIETGKSMVRDCQLILSDLSDISDEDAVEVAKMIGVNYRDPQDNITAIRNMVVRGDVLNVMEENMFVHLVVIDFLRSRSYMLPAFGITDLFEAGIAVRKETIKK